MVKYQVRFIENEKTIIRTFNLLSDAENLASIKNVSVDTITLPDLKDVPQEVTPRQIRLALIMSGKSLTDIENTINLLPEPDKSIAIVAWEYSTVFQREFPLLNQLAPLLNLTSDDIDDLFILAKTL